MLGEPLRVVAEVVAALNTLSIDYCVGGSLASSLYGKPRSTNDVDLVARVRSEHAAALVGLLAARFYIDEPMIRDAVRRRASFNVIHLETMFKVDVFVASGDPWTREELSRRRPTEVDVGDGTISLSLASPEDVVLHKLVWYRIGGEVSDRQWGDVLGVLSVQAPHLDDAYMDRWAVVLDVTTLLARARKQVG